MILLLPLQPEVEEGVGDGADRRDGEPQQRVRGIFDERVDQQSEEDEPDQDGGCRIGHDPVGTRDVRILAAQANDGEHAQHVVAHGVEDDERGQLVQRAEQDQHDGERALDGHGHRGDLVLRVQPLEAGEEVPLLSHGVVGPRLGDDAAVQRSEHGQGHAHRDDDGARVPQDPLSRGRAQVIILGRDHGLDLRERQDHFSFKIDDVEIYDILLKRYSNIEFIYKLDAETGMALVVKAIEETRRDKAFELYKMIYPLMGEENFITFEEYYKKAKQVDTRTLEEILEEVEELIELDWKEVD